MKKSQPRYTIIINTYPHAKRDRDLKRALSSLERQTYKKFEVLLIENHLNDELIIHLLKSYQKKLKIKVHSDPTKKLSYLFNLGWQLSKTEYLGYLADDAEASPEWLENINLELSQSKKIAAVSGPVVSTVFPSGEMHRLYIGTRKNLLTKILSWPYLHFVMENQILRPGKLFSSGAYSIGAGLKQSLKYPRQETDLLTTTSMGVRRTALKKILGFDERFNFNHADGDLFIRLKKSGYKLIFNPKIVVKHHLHLGPSRNAYHIGRDTGLFYKKHFKPRNPAHFLKILFNTLILNSYWVYSSIRTKDPKQLLGITGFFEGLYDSRPFSYRLQEKKLKILMFNRWVGYNEGGNETHIKELAVFLNKSGHEVDILTTGKSALTPIKKYLNHIYSVNSPKEYFSYSYKRFLYSIKYIFDSFVVLNKIVRKNNYDIITVHFSLEALIVRAIRAVFKLPYALILVGDTDLELIEGKRANNVSQLTKFMANECLYYGYYPEILTKGVDQKRFNPKVDGEKVRNQYIKKSDQLLVITVCRLDPRKNLETLIEAAKITENKYPDKIKYVIVGGGVEASKLKMKIKALNLSNIVHMVGPIPSTSKLLPQHYAASDVFALPTLYEGFGYVFTEAMAFGLPVIGTNTSAVPEVIADTGIVVPTKSPSKLASAILKLYKNKPLRHKLSQQSLKKVSQWYWDELIKDYEKFIYRAIDNYNVTSFSPIKELIYFLVDVPKILFIGLRPLLSVNNSWGSIKK